MDGLGDLTDRSELDWAGQDSTDCSIGHAAKVLGDKWALLLLRELTFGVNRFGVLQSHLNVSRRTLTERLAYLVDQGLVERSPYEKVGQRIRYQYLLTEAGRDLVPVLTALAVWGERYRPSGSPPPLQVIHASCKASVKLRAQCAAGHEVAWSDLRFVPGPGARRIDSEKATL